MAERSTSTPVGLIGTSQAMASIRRLISAVAPSPATVLVTGESGTGKELIARALHEQSDRSRGRFVALNCGAIPKELIESELFGHRKGSFTGALVDRVGRFELAHGGTLFLDEIGDLALDMQVKLLRVLQERVVDPVGAAQPVPVDVRVIAATHRDLEAEVSAGRFREDLYYRLNVLPIASPPLRDRGDDIPELLTFYAQRFARAGTSPISFREDTLLALQAYDWPGNVRELSNLMDRFSTLFPARQIALQEIPDPLLPRGLRASKAALQAAQEQPDGQVAHTDALTELLAVGVIPSAPPGLPDVEVSDVEAIVGLAQGMDVLPPEGTSLKDRVAELERRLIKQALERSAGNVSQTARLLNMQRTTLFEKLNKYDLRAA